MGRRPPAASPPEGCADSGGSRRAPLGWQLPAPLLCSAGSSEGHRTVSLVDVASIAISTVASLAALASLGVARRARGDSRRSADAAESAEHRAARPRLLVEPEGAVQHNATEVIYRVHNFEGPDLASVVVHRPVVGPADGGGVIYPVAATGRGDYGDDVEIGPIALAGYGRFTFKLGSRESLPDFRVKITYRAALGAPWEVSEPLTTPRGPAQLQVARELQQREREEQVADDQRVLDQARRVSYQLHGGAGQGGDGPTFEMTSLHVTVRNDSDLLATDVRLVVGENDFNWSPQGSEPVSPSGRIYELADLPHGALPRASHSEASKRPFRSYPSWLEYRLDGRRFTRAGEGEPALFAAE